MELPEAAFRTKAEAKRKELNELMAKFTKESEESQPSTTMTNKKYERPSERQKRVQGDRSHDSLKGEDPYASFGSNRNEGDHF
jgi:hypothetical protein